MSKKCLQPSSPLNFDDTIHIVHLLWIKRHLVPNFIVSLPLVWVKVMISNVVNNFFFYFVISSKMRTKNALLSMIWHLHVSELFVLEIYMHMYTTINQVILFHCWMWMLKIQNINTMYIILHHKNHYKCIFMSILFWIDKA